MKLQICKQMATLGLTLLILAAVARLSPLTPAARMADNLALIASGLLVVMSMAVGWHARRREHDPTVRTKAASPEPLRRQALRRTQPVRADQNHQ